MTVKSNGGVKLPLKTNGQFQSSCAREVCAVSPALTTQPGSIFCGSNQENPRIDPHINEKRDVETLAVRPVAVLLTHVAKVNHWTFKTNALPRRDVVGQGQGRIFLFRDSTQVHFISSVFLRFDIA